MDIRKVGLSAITAVIYGLTVIPAMAETSNMRFNVSYGMAKIGEMHVASTITENSFSTSGSLFTTGITGALYDARYDSNSQGGIDANGVFLPSLYTSVANEKGNITSAEIRYSGNTVSSVTFNPPKTIPANATSQSGVLDPMTMIYHLIRPLPADQVCTGDYAMFDGKQRNTVRFFGLKVDGNGNIECSVSYSGSGNSSAISISGMVFTPGSDGLMHIKQFSVDTGIGKLVARRR